VKARLESRALSNLHADLLASRSSVVSDGLRENRRLLRASLPRASRRLHGSRRQSCRVTRSRHGSLLQRSPNYARRAQNSCVRHHKTILDRKNRRRAIRCSRDIRCCRCIRHKRGMRSFRGSELRDNCAAQAAHFLMVAERCSTCFVRRSSFRRSAALTYSGQCCERSSSAG